MLSVIAAALDATLLDSAEELMGATELAGVELGAAELAGVELGATELAAVELGTGDGAGLLPPPPPPQAVSPNRTMGRAQVLIDRDEGEDARGFETQSGQLYLVLQPKDSRFSLYIDEQIAPGGALNRETFILTKLNGNHFLKAGRIMLPYGIRLEDDSAFIRQASGFNFDTGDNGVELGLQYTKTLFNFAISNGSSGLNNDDKNLQFLSRAEYLGNNWRIGATALYNDAEAGARTQANVFGGFVWQGFVFLAEADLIEDESIETIPGEYQQQRVGLLEVNREISKGYNVKFTTEYLDPDTNIDENQRVRHSLLLEYTPFANLQIRGGLRKGDDIPQRDAGNYLDFFAQLHFYY